MSFWDDLKKKAMGALAEINPFDGGQTYDTVVNNKPVQQPVKRSPAVEVPPSRQQTVQSTNKAFGITQSVPSVKAPSIVAPKPPEAPQPPQKPAKFDPTTITQPGAKPLSLAAPAAQPKSAPAPQKPQSFTPSINDVGKFLFENPAKLANQGASVVSKAGVHLVGETQKAFGDKAGGDRTIQEGEKSINNTLLKPGSGLFGVGGLYDSLDALHKANPMDVAKKAGGAGIETAADIIPVGTGFKIAKAASPIVNKIAANAIVGAGSNAVGSVGSQLATEGRVDPGQIALDSAAGAALGGAIPLAGEGAKQLSKTLGGLSRDLKNRALVSAADGSAPVTLPTNKLVAYETAPDRTRIDEYKARLQGGGSVEPLYVMKDSNGNLSVEDGKHRLQAMNELGIPTTQAYVVTPESLSRKLEEGFIKIPGADDGASVQRDANIESQPHARDTSKSTTTPALISETSSATSIPDKAQVAIEAERRGLVSGTEAKKAVLMEEAKARGLVPDRAPTSKDALIEEANRRGLLGSKTPPVEVFGPEPTFPTVKRTGATDFYKNTTRRADLDTEPNVVDPTKMNDLIEAKQNKVGEQFAKPNDAIRMSGGNLDNVENGTILSESKSGNQRRRMFIRPDGRSTIIEETRNPDGSWVEMREPAIEHAGDFRGIDSLEGHEDLTSAAIKAMRDGKEIHMYADRSNGSKGLSADLHEFDPEKHVIDGGFVRDANNGAILGNHVKVDDTGIAINIGKKMVNMNGVVGDPAKWRNMNKVTYTIDRMLEAAAPNKDVYRKVRKFVIENKQASEAKMRVDLRDFRKDLSDWRKNILKKTPRRMSQKDFMRDIFYYAERKLSQDKELKGSKLSQDQILDAKFGKETANEIRKFDKWARGEYDSLLDRTNEVLRRFGHEEVLKRQNYMTHLQEDSLWDKIGIGEDLYRDLSSGIGGETNLSNRGGLPGNIAGQTEDFRPTKKYNPFHQARRGKDSMTDPFRAMDAYAEAAMFNIHMTEPAVRARSVESVFRAAEAIVNKDMLKSVSDDLRKSLKESVAGNRGDLVIAFQEYANTLAGKSNQFDRKLQDGMGTKGRVALRLARMLQKIASNSSIVGSANVTLAQTLNLPNVIGTNGIRSTMRGIARMVGDIHLNGEPKPGSPASKSDFLKVRYTDAQSKINRGRLQKTNDVISKSMLMPQVEQAMTEIAWQSSYEKALKNGYKGREAIKEADRITERIVGGRGIGDQPDIYRSTIGRTFLQYTLEVNAALKNVRMDMNPRGKIKFAAAVFALNYGMQQLTGRAPLSDFLGATIDTGKDVFNFDSYDDNDGDGKPDETILDKAARAGQRFASETAKASPALTVGANVLGKDARKVLFGDDSDLGRYDGSPAAAQVVGKLIEGLGDLSRGDLASAGDKALSAIPYGGQIRKSLGGVSAMDDGVARDSSGKPTTTVDTSSPLTWIKAALFGKNAIPEVKAYYEGGGSSLSDKQANTFDKLKESNGIASARDYLSAVIQKRGASKGKEKDDFATFAAEAKVKLKDGSWKEKDGVVVDSDTGEVVRSYYKKLAKEAAESDDRSDEAYDAFVKGYGLKELGGGKAAKTGNSTLDQLNKLTAIDDKKDVIGQAIDLIKKSNAGYEDIPDWVTEKYLDSNKIDKNDALYAAKASYSNDTKLPVIQSDIKDMSHDQVMDYLAKGRVESIKGGFWATQGVLADLRDQGVISRSEYSYLNKLKRNKDGSEKAGSGGSGSRKAKTVSASELKSANATTDLEKSIANIIKQAGKTRDPKNINYKKRK
ncbi:MAG TPA: hypothetical protein VJ841_03620 [Candidatus Saccharimonadales bacterium]|nr:hypothetical protein [Candidatus Saccharimonadales bacterium]